MKDLSELINYRAYEGPWDNAFDTWVKQTLGQLGYSYVRLFGETRSDYDGSREGGRVQVGVIGSGKATIYSYDKNLRLVAAEFDAELRHFEAVVVEPKL